MNTPLVLSMLGSIRQASRQVVTPLRASSPSKRPCFPGTSFAERRWFASDSSDTLKLTYQDGFLRSVLKTTKVIGMVGASTNETRASYFAMKYLQSKGFRVVPINPMAAGKTLLGETVYADLEDIPDDIRIDMVDVFRRPEDTVEYAKQASRIGAKHLWLQLGVVNHETREIAEAAGLTVVMDRCPKIEFARLFGELGWLGFDTKVISSKKRASMDSDAKDSDSKSAEKPTFNGFGTRCIHAGSSPCDSTGARVTPIYQNTSYVFDDVNHGAALFDLQVFGNIYSRLSNPTTAVLEERMAALEGGRGSTCTASGHSAQMLALFPLMQPGDRIVASNKLYGGSLTQFGKTFQKFGWECEFVDVSDREAVRAALARGNDRTKALWTESLANPGGIVSDLEMLSELAKEAHVPFIVDNTLATPYLLRPIEYGADLVVHSTTKFASGHGNAMGGCVVDSGKFDWGLSGKFPSLTDPEPAYHGLKFFETFGDLCFTIYAHAVGLRDLGPTMAPQNAFMTITGLETLPLRMDKHCSNAMKVASFLENDPRVSWVSYSGLQSSMYHSLSMKYMPRGAGSVFTFGVEGGFDAGIKVAERCELFSLLANVGDTRSLILHPASTTHRQLSKDAREAAGAGDDVLRLSIGLEDPEDLIKDLDWALGGDNISDILAKMQNHEQ